MERLILEALEVLAENASLAYWHDHEHCGGDFKPDSCTDCPSYEYCKNTSRLDTIISSLKSLEVGG